VINLMTTSLPQTSYYAKLGVSTSNNIQHVLGGPTKVKPTYIFVCKI